MSIVIRIHLSMIVAYQEDKNHQFTQCLGQFNSLKQALSAFKGKDSLFIEDCLFNTDAGIQRYRPCIPQGRRGKRTPDKIPIEPIKRPARSHRAKKNTTHYLKTEDNGCLLVTVSPKDRITAFPYKQSRTIACNLPGEHPHIGFSGSLALAVKNDLSDITKAADTIALSPSLCFIHPGEPLQAFVKRIQFAAITAATQTEGNHTRAAKRLGYGRSALVTLLSRLKEGTKSKKEKAKKRSIRQKRKATKK